MTGKILPRHLASIFTTILLHCNVLRGHILLVLLLSLLLLSSLLLLLLLLMLLLLSLLLLHTIYLKQDRSFVLFPSVSQAHPSIVQA